jgi:hypothetical protein
MAWGVVRRWNPFFHSLINKLINQLTIVFADKEKEKEREGNLGAI